MTAFRDIAGRHIVMRPMPQTAAVLTGIVEPWSLFLGTNLLRCYWTREAAIADANAAKDSISQLRRMVLERSAELGEQIAYAQREDRLDEAASLCGSRWELLRNFLLIRQAWNERLSQHDELAPNVHAVLREMTEAARAAF